MKNFIENTMDRTAYRMACASVALRRRVTDFMTDEDGESNLVAVLLIIVVTVALVAIFKTRLTGIVNGILDSIEKAVKKI